MSGAPSSSEPVAHPPVPADARADVSADSALILAALGRLETAVRDERAVLGRLRRSLADMAQAIGRAKAVADSETSAILLDEFEHRVDAMIEIAGGAPQPIEASAPAAIAAPAEVAPQAHAPAEMAAEHDQVPTVFDVVSRLGPNVVGADDETSPTAETAPPAEDASHSAPSVAMLTAMVEALRDSISAAAPEPAADSPQDAEPQETEIALLEAVALDLSPIETAPVDEQPAEPEPVIAALEIPEAVAEATPSAMEIAEVAMEPAAAIALYTSDIAPTPPGEALLHERSLLASLEQMGARPFPPQEEGTAVIFTPRFAPEFTPTFTAAFAPEPPAEATIAVELEPSTPVALAATPVEALLAEATASEAIAVEMRPEAAAADAAPTAAIVPAPEPPAAEAEAEFDPADFLFGPEPPEPPAVLLDPPHPQAMLPQAEFVTTPPIPGTEAQQTESQADCQVESQLEAAPRVEIVQPTHPAPEPRSDSVPDPHDPLRALKAMSENERIALFT